MQVTFAYGALAPSQCSWQRPLDKADTAVPASAAVNTTKDPSDDMTRV